MNLDRILRGVTKPARYTGGEWNSIQKGWDEVDVRVALAFPDVYEIGMSNMGLAILYDLLNREPHILAERVYAPWPDMEAALRREKAPLFSLESRRPLAEFDVIGFSLGYELTYTNVLNMLDLAGIPLRSAQRTRAHPLIIAGGSCATNPEPLADFMDLFVVGEGEEVALELMELFRRWKAGGGSREELLNQAAQIPGVYVPILYDVSYRDDGTLGGISPAREGGPQTVERRIVSQLPPILTRPVVPHIQIVHDRAAIEIQRGCTRGCRFCQAGIIYRPVRCRSVEEIVAAAGELLRNTGYNELSLVSLSTADYPHIWELVNALVERYRNTRLSISLPSLRVDSFSVKLADTLSGHKKGSLTFAPEAGNERMRRVINKGVTEEDMLSAAEAAFSQGWTTLKLYFMVGLPTETMEDVAGIAGLARKVKDVGRRCAGGRAQVNVSVATLVPKPHTPFQWMGQDTSEALLPKHDLLRNSLKRSGIRLSWHDTQVSLLEAVFSRGDRRLGAAVERAWQLGCRFDAWSELFCFDKWQQAMADCGLDMSFYAHRERSLNEVLPWGHIDSGASHAFLWREHQRIKSGRVTPDCRFGPCAVCGLYYREASCAEKFHQLLGEKRP